MLHRNIFVPSVTLGIHHVGDICSSLCDITLDIHGKTRSFGDSETEVKRKNTRDASKTNNETPHIINRDDTRERGVESFSLVCLDDDNTDKGSSCVQGALMKSV
jgi:hypothetical protein